MDSLILLKVLDYYLSKGPLTLKNDMDILEEYYRFNKEKRGYNSITSYALDFDPSAAIENIRIQVEERKKEIAKET